MSCNFGPKSISLVKNCERLANVDKVCSDFEPREAVFTKSDRNHRHFYINVINLKTELTRYTTACGKMCDAGPLVFTTWPTSLPLPGDTSNRN